MNLATSEQFSKTKTNNFLFLIKTNLASHFLIMAPNLIDKTPMTVKMMSQDL